MSSPRSPRALSRLFAALPKSRALEPEVFRARHRVVVAIIGAHAAGLAVFGLIRGFPAGHVALESSVLAALALAAMVPASARAKGLLAATGLVTSSAVLVHFSGGAIEAHFHFFVILGLMTLYHDWTSYLVAFGYVVLHHGVLGVLDPIAVYDHTAAQVDPWTWAAIHGVFVLGACIVQVYTWHMLEREHDRAERYLVDLRSAQLRRRQALNINDSIVQSLIVAKLAWEIGDRARSEEAYDRALHNARAIISDLIGDDGAHGAEPVTPGELIRDIAADAREVHA